MDKRPEFRLEQTPILGLKQAQRLMMLPQMQQALYVLQMPILELSTLMETELEHNPILEVEESSEGEGETEPPIPETDEVNFDDPNFEILKILDEEFQEHFSQDQRTPARMTSEEEKRRTFLDSLICAQETLSEHLMAQARDQLDSEDERQAAELLIGYLDDRGFLTTPIREIAQLQGVSKTTLTQVHRVLQTFDPAGIGASNLQEALLIQLSRRGAKKTLAYAIVSGEWDHLLHHRIPVIARHLGASPEEVDRAIKQTIATLNLHPAANFTAKTAPAIIPDVTINQDGEKLTVAINDEPLPLFHINRRYLKLLENPETSHDTREFIKQKLSAVKWLWRTVDQRNSTLFRITEHLIKSQADFFTSPDGLLSPLRMKSVAEALALNESTIARAVAGKYVNSPRGLLPLRSFFTNGVSTERGLDISSQTVRDAVAKLIEGENKRKPLSDALLSTLLKKQGIVCARRTVAKYRGQLNIGSAQQRRSYL